MTSTIRVTCDRCGEDIVEVPTALLELRVGTHRVRRHWDFCADCYQAMQDWIAEYKEGTDGQGEGM